MSWNVVREPTILATAAVYGFLIQLALLAGLFGLWLLILLTMSTWRYSYSVLRAVAQGHQRIPPPDLDSLNPIGEWAVVFHFLLFPGLILAVALSLGWIASLIVAVALVCIYPASVALTGLTSSTVAALSPAAIRHFVRTVGSEYWLLVIGNLGIFLGAAFVASVVLPAFGLIGHTVAVMLFVWAVLASFARIGLVLRANRLEFEIAGEVKPREEEFLQARHAEWRKDLDIAYIAFRSGMLSAGYHTLHELVDSNNDSIEVNHWLVENMLEWEEKRYAFEVVEKLMPRLLARGDQAGALELYQRCRRRNPDFRPPAAQAEKIAVYAEAIGQTGLANELSYTPETHP